MEMKVEVENQCKLRNKLAFMANKLMNISNNLSVNEFNPSIGHEYPIKQTRTHNNSTMQNS